MQHLVEHRVLVGDAAVDAIGATEDKREELERKRTEAMNTRSIAGRGMAGRGAGRVDFGSFGTPSEKKNFGTK